jgi:hypothetical protein
MKQVSWIAFTKLWDDSDGYMDRQNPNYTTMPIVI